MKKRILITVHARGGRFYARASHANAAAEHSESPEAAAERCAQHYFRKASFTLTPASRSGVLDITRFTAELEQKK